MVFDYGNNLRAGAELGGLAHDRAYAYPGFVPAFIRPLFCEGQGPVPVGGAVRRSGRHPARPTGRWPSCSRRTSALQRWIRLAEERVAFQGLPARICWLGYGERDQAGLRVQRAGRARARSRRRS